jgi:hypothetical protein
VKQPPSSSNIVGDRFYLDNVFEALGSSLKKTSSIYSFLKRSLKLWTKTDVKIAHEK